jgi:hypothetical protein
MGVLIKIISSIKLTKEKTGLWALALIAVAISSFPK